MLLNSDIVILVNNCGRRRLSREPAMDDDYRLLKFFAAVVEMRLNGSSTITKRVEGVAGERGRLPAGQEAREELLLHLMSQLESLESLVQAMASFGGQLDHGRAGAVAGESAAPAVDGAVVLSASFQRRASALCRDRAEQANTVAQSLQSGPEDAGVRPELKAAVAELRFRAAAYELYTLLEAVELQPAGTGGGDEDEDPAFLPPGKRGWKHALLCEEAAGWADLMREGGGSRGTRLLCAELPDFQVRVLCHRILLCARVAQKRTAPGKDVRCRFWRRIVAMMTRAIGSAASWQTKITCCNLLYEDLHSCARAMVVPWWRTVQSVIATDRD